MLNNVKSRNPGRKSISLLLFFLMIIFFQNYYCQDKPQFNLDSELKIDASITSGTLNNGLKYFIRQNKKPENRAELRLAVNAGSILEDNDQLGLAHFAEHMGFNGTENFKKQELINFLESIGMKFGPEVNAYTSFDETVYMIQVPTDSAEVFEKAFQVLEEWAHNVSFNDEEVDKERGVVIEEWRLGRGAGMRMLDKQLPIIFKNSKYAERLPIGKKEILESFKYETIKKFYKDWYRPDLMAVIAVGDFDVKTAEEFIKKYFSRIEHSENPREREYSQVPDHKEPYFAIASDKEATYSSVSVYFMKDVESEITINDYRDKIIQNLYNGMFNQRLYELTKLADPPFVGAFSGYFDIIRTKAAYALSARVKDNGIEKGLQSLLTEAKRVEHFGFTEGELEREKKNMLRRMERAFNEKDKTESVAFTDELVRHFLEKEPVPGIETEYEMYKEFIPGIKLNEINKLAADFISDNNQVILVNSPEKEGVIIPTEKGLLDVFQNVKSEKVIAYEDKLGNEALLSEMPKPAEITSEKKIDEIGTTELQLSNGVRVVLKSTDFKNDEVLFNAFSPGGSSLVSDDKFVSASTATGIVNESGLGKFSSIDLQKMLAGKIVNVSPWISDIEEGLSGSASPADLETMFQLIYLHFTSPRIDSAAFQSYLTKNKTFLENKSADPRWAFQDTVQNVMANYHFRATPWTIETLNEIDLKTAIGFYKDRFADASDFTFVFVGNFDLEKMKSFIKTYLGGLPTLKRTENWKDTGMRNPEGIVTKEVKKGIEPKSQVYINFPGKFDWNSENNYALKALTNTLQIKLREVVREEKSGTYGIGIYHSASHYPIEKYNITVTFGCDPDRVEELISTVFTQLDSVMNFGIEESYVNKVKEQHLRSREVDLKTNRTWLGALRGAYSNNEDPREFIKNENLIHKLNMEQIHNAAKKYFDMENYIKVVLYPEDVKPN